MSEYSTIESFFLADYEKLRKENEELKNTINEYELQFKASTSEDGFTDLGKSVCAVRYEVASSYSVFSNDLKNLTVEQLGKIAEKDDSDIWEWASNTKVGSYYGNIAKRETHTFPFSVLFKTYKGVKKYAYDPDKSRTSLVEVGDTADTEEWVSVQYDDQCKNLAVEEIREIISRRIEELNKSE